MGWRMAGGNCCCNCVISRDAYVESITVNGRTATQKLKYPDQDPPFPTGQSGDIVAYDHKNRRTFTTRNDFRGIFSIDHSFKDRIDHLTYLSPPTGTTRCERGICVDPDNEHIYYVSRVLPLDDFQSVSRVNYDGTGEQIIATEFGYYSASASELAISRFPKYIFWSKLAGFGVADPAGGANSDMAIVRVSPNGATSTIVTQPRVGSGPWVTTGGLGIDNTRNKLYYCIWCGGAADVRQARIYRCDFDGSNSELINQQIGTNRIYRFAGYSHIKDRIYWMVVLDVPGSHMRWMSAAFDGSDVKIEIDTSTGGNWNGRNLGISYRLACGYQSYPLGTH